MPGAREPLAKTKSSKSSNVGRARGEICARTVTGCLEAPPPARYCTLMSRGNSEAATSGSAGGLRVARMRGTRNSSTRNPPEASVGVCPGEPPPVIGGQVEAPRLYPLLPARVDEGEIVRGLSGDEEATSQIPAGLVALGVGDGTLGRPVAVGQSRGPGHAVRIRGALPERPAVAVEHGDLGPAHRLRLVEGGDPDERARSAPLEMSGQIGDEGARGDVHGLGLAEERG